MLLLPFLPDLGRWGTVVFDAALIVACVIPVLYFSLLRPLQRSAVLQAKKEESLRISESKFRRYIESSPYALLVTDETGLILDANDAATKISGYAREDLLTMNIGVLFHPEEKSICSEHFSRVVATGRATGVVAIATNEGAKRYWEIEAVALGDNRFLGFISDVTGRVEAEQALQQQSRLQELLMKMAATYLYLPSEAVESTISASLRDLAEFVGADRIGIYDYDFHNQTVTGIYEWCREGVAPGLADFQAFPIAAVPDRDTEAHRRGESIWVPDVLSMPPGPWADELKQYNVKSILSVPVMSSGECTGYVSFNWTRQRHVVLGEAQCLLTYFAHMLASIRQRKQVEDALRENQARLDLALRSADMGAWQVEFETGQHRFDSQTCQLLGLDPRTFAGSAEEFYAAVHPDDREFIKAQLNYAVDRRTLYEVEFRTVWPDGSIHYVNARGMTAFDDGGKRRKLNGTLWDITDRKKIEDAVRHERDRAQQYLDTAETMIVVLNTEGRITVVNKKGCRVLGRCEEELVGQNWFTTCLPQPDGCERVYPVFQKIMTGDIEALEYFEYPIITRRGELRQIAWHNALMRNDQGRIEGVLSSGDDITERKRAEETLRESEGRYRNFVRNATEGIYRVDFNPPVPLDLPERELIERLDQSAIVGEVNDHLAHMYGLSASDMIGRLATDFAPGYGERALLAVRALDYQVEDLETQDIDRDGRAVLLLENFTGVVEDGRLTHIWGMQRNITERKKVEEALRESEFFFKESQRAAHIGSYKCNFITGQWESSEVLDQIFGIDKDYSKGVQGWLALVHPDDREMMSWYLEEEVIAKGQPFDKEYRIIRKVDGETRWLNGLGTVACDRDGRAISLIGTIQDITERKRAANEIQKSKEFSESIINSMPGIFYVFDGNGAFLRINERLAVVAACSMEEVMSMHPLDFFAANEKEKVARAIREAFEKGKSSVEAELLSRDGSKTPYYFTGYSTMIDDAPLLVGLGIDSSGLKRTEEALWLSESRYHELFDSVLEGLGVVDKNEIIEYCNPAFAEIFEASSKEDLIGKSLLDYIPQEQLGRVLGQTELRMQGLSSRYEVDIVTARGNRRTLLVSVAPRFDDERNYCGASGAMIDITETKRLQELESRAQRLETVGRIAGEVAHDFNNLLGPIMAYPELIRGELPEGHKTRGYLTAIENAAGQIAAINQDLLTLGRRGHYAVEPLNLNSVISHALREIEPLPETMVCEVELCEDLMDIRGGTAQIHRAISNLLHNAKDAFNGVGTLTVKTENYYADDVTVAFGRVPKGEYVKITISDTGCGIPDDILQKVFEPFFTTKKADRKRGSGLGLSVVDSVIRDHGGYLDLKTSVGIGTSFYLYFPACREREAGGKSEETVGGTESVLIVDDDAMQREVVTGLLTKLGYRISQAESGEQALELLRQAPVDLLILDMIMPGGMDGAETYREAVRINPEQKAIIVSGFSESKRVIEAQAAGAGGFVKKPLTMKVIATAVRRELDKQRSVPVASL